MKNVIETRKIQHPARCPSVTGERRVSRELGAYLADESRIVAASGVKAVFFPRNVRELCGAVLECSEKNMRISVAGARTGIVGGAVPAESEAVISVEHLNKIGGLGFSESDGGRFNVHVGAGVVLADLQEALRTTPVHDLPWKDGRGGGEGMKMLEKSPCRLFYPVDPTETTAQIGGTIATDASGARSYFYGSTRRWVESVKLITATGELLDIKRGDCVAENGKFLLKHPSGGVDEIRVPDIRPVSAKSTAGYYMDNAGMDALDLFAGSEGTLGIIAEAGLRLTFEPLERLFLTAFLPSEADALKAVEGARRLEEIKLLALEYIGPNAIALLRRRRAQSGASGGVPPIPEPAACTLYIEAAFDGDEEFRRCCEELRKLILDAGGSPRQTWAGCSYTQMRAMKEFRHAVPEMVNSTIAARRRKHPSIHKVGTDMAVPDSHLRDVLSLYRRELEACGLQYLIFGHIGDNHLHVNILPESERDMDLARKLYGHFAGEVVKMGGSVSAEHGIGRIKRDLLRHQFDEGQLAAMQRVKNIFDPQGLLNPGVMF